MKIEASLAAVLSLSALAACGSGANRPDITTSSVNVRGHGMALSTDAAGTPAFVYDKSDAYLEGNVTRTMANGVPISANAGFDGKLDNGTSIPGRNDMKVDAANLNSFTATDAFLSVVRSGNAHGLYAYGTRGSGRDYTVYASGGDRTGNMPTSGMATFNGGAEATVFSSLTGKSVVTGKSQLTANFSNGTVSGKLYELNGALAGTDIVLGQRAVVGPNFTNGEVALTVAGTQIPNATLTSSDYQGSFFGSGAGEAAGTFQFSATNMPTLAGTQNLSGVGGFSASR